jgi:hypothetical protein
MSEKSKLDFAGIPHFLGVGAPAKRKPAKGRTDIRGGGYVAALQAAQLLDRLIAQEIGVPIDAPPGGRKRPRPQEPDDPTQPDEEQMAIDTSGTVAEADFAMPGEAPADEPMTEQEVQALEREKRQYQEMQEPALKRLRMINVLEKMLIPDLMTKIFAYITNARDYARLMTSSAYLYVLGSDKLLLREVVKRILDEPDYGALYGLDDKIITVMRNAVEMLESLDEDAKRSESPHRVEAKAWRDLFHCFSCPACIGAMMEIDGSTSDQSFSLPHAAAWILPFVATVHLSTSITMSAEFVADHAVLHARLEQAVHLAILDIVATSISLPCVPKKLERLTLATNDDGVIYTLPKVWPDTLNKIHITTGRFADSYMLANIPRDIHDLKIWAKGGPHLVVTLDRESLRMPETGFATVQPLGLRLKHCTVRTNVGDSDWFANSRINGVRYKDMAKPLLHLGVKDNECDQLQWLRVSGCQLWQSPLYADYQALRTLNLENSGCGRWIEELQWRRMSGTVQFPNLLCVRFGENSITKFPPWLIELSTKHHGLEVIDLSHNLIEELPDEVGFMHCAELVVSHNVLRKIPSTIRYISRLNLDHNLLTMFPMLGQRWVEELSMMDNLFNLETLEATPIPLKDDPDDVRCWWKIIPTEQHPGAVLTHLEVQLYPWKDLNLALGTITLPHGTVVWKRQNVLMSSIKLKMQGPTHVDVHAVSDDVHILSDTLMSVSVQRGSLGSSYFYGEIYVECPHLQVLMVPGTTKLNHLEVTGGQITHVEGASDFNRVTVKNAVLDMDEERWKEFHDPIMNRAKRFEITDCKIKQAREFQINNRNIHFQTLDLTGTTGAKLDRLFDRFPREVVEDPEFENRLRLLLPRGDHVGEVYFGKTMTRSIRPNWRTGDPYKLPAVKIPKLFLDVSDNKHVTGLHKSFMQLAEHIPCKFDISGTSINALPDQFFESSFFHHDTPKMTFVVDEQQLRKMEEAAARDKYEQLRVWRAQYVEEREGKSIYKLVNWIMYPELAPEEETSEEEEGEEEAEEEEWEEDWVDPVEPVNPFDL